MHAICRASHHPRTEGARLHQCLNTMRAYWYRPSAPQARSTAAACVLAAAAGTRAVTLALWQDRSKGPARPLGPSASCPSPTCRETASGALQCMPPPSAAHFLAPRYGTASTPRAVACTADDVAWRTRLHRYGHTAERHPTTPGPRARNPALSLSQAQASACGQVCRKTAH